MKLTVSSIQSSFNATKMSIIDACRKVARERNARTVLRFAPKKKTSHQSNGFVEAVHGRIHGFARCCQTQIETNTGIQLSAISFAIPFSIRHAGFVLSRFTVRPTAERHSNICSELRMYHSVFALIPDHGVRAAKVTNRCISGCWWGRDASSDEHLVGRMKHGLLECRTVRRKRSRLEGRNGPLMWKRSLEYLDHLWLHVQMKGCRQQRHRSRFPQYLHLHFRQRSKRLKFEVKVCNRKHSGSEPSGQKAAETPGLGEVRHS